VTDWQTIAHDHGMHRTDLYTPHGTDKSAHGYMAHYQRLLKHRTVHRLLEIGVQSGASLAVWHQLLPDTEVVGIDINPVAPIAGVEIRQRDGRLAPDDPDETFDVIIDDASHLATETDATLDVWADRLTPDGLYVVEDAVFGNESWIQSIYDVIAMLLAHGLTPLTIERSKMPWVAHKVYGGMMALVAADQECDIPQMFQP